MKFTLKWLEDYLETSASLDEITTSLTSIGLEVENVCNPADGMHGFIVAEILSASKHPNADKLKLCEVFDGNNKLQIVCGAENARAGIKVVLAPVGTVIPTNGMKIKKSNIRGIESNGMLCSANELGLGDDSSGIMELPSDSTPGMTLIDLLQLDDPVIEIAITPNRADCTAVYGIARDLAAAGIGKLKPLKRTNWHASGKSVVNVTIEDKGCRQFIGCSITNVQNCDSPQWLQQRLKAIGLRPISALVDITNYITYDLGRPLHVYDIDRLNGNIVVKSQCGGQSFLALNDKEYTLENDDIAITDASSVLGLGGIIGGTSSGCSDETRNVFLEVAYFEPVRIAKTGRRLQISSDARYRFERGVDPNFLEEGAKQAVQMILDICGGSASELIYAGHNPHIEKTINYNAENINKLAGINISREKQHSILEKLGFDINGQNISIPSWRGDISVEADLSEEILRIYGYDNIPSTLLPKPSVITGKKVLATAQERVNRIRKLLAVRGLTECITWSFISENAAQLFGGAKQELKLLNPISSELNIMRPSLLPNLLEAAKNNADRGFMDLQLFEIGRQFESIAENSAKLVVACIRSGSIIGRNHYKTERQQDVFDVKADCFAILEAMGLNPNNLILETPAAEWYHPGRSGKLKLGNKLIGYFGEINPIVLQKINAPESAVGLEIFIENIPASKRKTQSKPTLQISDYPMVERDFSFVVDYSLPADKLLRTVKNSDKQLIKDVRLFDIYEGKNIPDNKKALAINVILQAANRTLTDQEIEDIARNIIMNAEKLGAQLRIAAAS